MEVPGGKARHSLNSSVRNMLIVRMVVVGAAMSIVLGAAVLWHERDKVSDAVVENTVRRAELFASQNGNLFDYPSRLDEAAIRKAILAFAKSRDGFPYGRVVYLGVFAPDLRPVTEVYDDTYSRLAAVKRAVENTQPTALASGSVGQEIIRLDGVPHLRITLGGIGGTASVNAQMIFAFSDATIAEFRMRGLRAAALAALVVLLTTLAMYPIIHNLTQRITDFSVRLLDANLDTLETLGSAIAKRDSDTNAHNYRVTLYAAAIGRRIGLPPETMRSLIKGSLLHDVGKIGIPDRILLKPGKLDAEEFKIMKTHVDLGGQIVGRSAWLRDALDVVYGHHEAVAGTGYPAALAGEGIPLTARIFAIADVFDALTSKRPYKEPWPYEKAMEILEEGRGTHFSPDLLDAFAQVARPLYDRVGGREDVPRDDLAELMRMYFAENMKI